MWNAIVIPDTDDDTGLEVAALDGAPGVYSGRYAGDPRSDDRNVDLLLKNMDGKKDRKAAFRTTIALIIGKDEWAFEGKAEGELLEVRSGEGGFGYDPIFKPLGFDKTFAELSLEEKNTISHRGKAVRLLAAFLKERA